MKKQRFNSKAWLMKHKDEDGHGMIYVRIFVNSSRAEISTNQKVPIKQWCNKKNRVKSSLSDATRVNSLIDQIEGKLKKHFLFFEAMDYSFSKE